MRLDIQAAFFITFRCVSMIQYRNFLILSVLLCFCGCSSPSGNVGLVEGVVTIDGAPVAGGTVTFYPTSGRGSLGNTDENGHYELRYTRNENGAVIGEHQVTISTKVEAGGYEDDAVEAQKETIPRKYRDRKKTELTATVESGSNTINFDLKSK